MKEACKKMLKKRDSEALTLAATTICILSRLRYTGIYPHKTNMISRTVFATSSISVHPV
jgi:hypothetical protein